MRAIGKSYRGGWGRILLSRQVVMWQQHGGCVLCIRGGIERSRERNGLLGGENS
jgi:hypothetical protein